MRKKILATLKKEALVMVRDWGGLLLLFLMPALLIVVMALVQDAPFREFRTQKIELLFHDEDGSSRLSLNLRKALDSSGHFRTLSELDGAPLTEERMKQALQSGAYSLGIQIPAGAQAELVNASQRITNRFSSSLGLGVLPSRPPREDLQIRLYFDPITKPGFRQSTYRALETYLYEAQTQYMMERMDMLVLASTSLDSLPPLEAGLGIGLAEYPVSEFRIPGKHLSSVQHNVPAWTLFGMFFIILPIITHSIKEREEGTALRLRMVPGASIPVLVAKVLFFTLFCTAQFWIMMSMGYTVLPWMGLDRLHLGDKPLALTAMALCISFAASSLGFLFGHMFRTTNQALPVGSITIVLLAAIGGIWVPIELFPPVLHRLAQVSPLYWSMEAVQNLMIRDLAWTANRLPLVWLTALGTVCLLASLIIEKKRLFSP